MNNIKHKKRFLFTAACALVLLPSLPAFADLASKLTGLTGYTIVGVKTVVGFVDTDGSRKDGFEGCNFGRVIIFSDNTILTCAGYGYQYAFNPQAILLARQGSWKMIIDSDVYDMQR
jgi:hypothetical protein